MLESEGTCVTVLGRWRGLFRETHFPSLIMASCSTQVTTVRKDMAYSDMFREILWNLSNKWSHLHASHHAFQAHIGFAGNVACTVYHNTNCNLRGIPLLLELWRKIQDRGQVAPLQCKSEKFSCSYQELQIFAWNLCYAVFHQLCKGKSNCNFAIGLLKWGSCFRILQIYSLVYDTQIKCTF